ncbi:MAG: hypothetical protein JWR19_309 [Pedosphaera sp.]|nr:hypothetical protein [Pedosphaera sp.]
MRTKLRWMALIAALVIVALWFFGGPNLGFTKNFVWQVEKDPVTELEVKRQVSRWVPGVDFLAGGLAVAGVVAGSSFFFGRKKGMNSHGREN